MLIICSIASLWLGLHRVCWLVVVVNNMLFAGLIGGNLPREQFRNGFTYFVPGVTQNESYKKVKHPVYERSTKSEIHSSDIIALFGHLRLSLLDLDWR